jgi:predicted nucleic-acid-binding protein
LQSFYRFPKTEVHTALKAFTALPLSYEEKTDIPVAVDLHASHSVKFVDALLASHHLLHNGKMTIISYDKDFDKLSVKRVEPQDVVSI